MKNLILPLLLLCATLLSAQSTITPIPNAGFENWTTVKGCYPTNYATNPYVFDPQYLFSDASLITKVAGYESSTGVQIKIGGLIASSNVSGEPDFSEGAPDFSNIHGGIPYNQKPTGIKGYYKWQANDEAMGAMIVIFSKDGANIGTYLNIFSNATEYTAFELKFNTPSALTETPDSVIIGFITMADNTEVNGALTIDKIEFTGVESQPTLLNGDFEEWIEVSAEKADDWYYVYETGKKTEDAYAGQYAFELTTTENYGGNLSNGYQTDYTSNIFYEGLPFTNQRDVFEFYYKLTESGDCSEHPAALYLNFLDDADEKVHTIGHRLHPSAEYKKEEVSIDLRFVPAKVVMIFTSGSGVGSVLKVDAIRFQSEQTGLKNVFTKEISIYPNFTDKGFYLPKDLVVDKVTIIDLRGAEMLNVSGKNNYVNVSSLAKGIYIVLLNTKEGVYKNKLIKK
ncbi:MAG TPA: T9SS type A sorting domain-containing protein [Bacteroidales bacterium]|nr:T9SS type A sorting domain-containing protein [Bacteroidales bacterium]